VTPAEYALAYAALGWHVFPLWPGKKVPLDTLVPDGQNNATTDEAKIRTWWEAFPAAGIGVACKPSGIVVLDVDPRHGGHFDMERLEAQHGPITSDVLAFTGGGGTHLVFRAPEGVRFPGKLAKGIDIKANGYIVVEPSIHPDTGRRYEWEASSSPLEDGEPSVLPAWIVELARTTGADGVPVDAVAPAGPGVSEHDLAEIRNALAMIPAAERDTWLAVGMALHRDVGGALGFDLWCQWSQTCPEKFDRQDQQRVWRSFTRRPMGQAIQLGTLFDLAYKHGFQRQRAVVPAAPAAVPVLQLVTQEPDPRTLATAPVLVEGNRVSAIAMPVQGLNELALWAFESCAHSHPLLAQATALALACACAGRRYVSEFGDPAHVFFGLMASTASQAQPMLTAAESALLDSGLRRLARTQRFTSPQQVYAAFVRSPSFMYCADDWGDQLRFAKRQPSGLLEQTLAVISGKVHPGRVVALDNWGELGMKRPEHIPSSTLPTLYRPSMTLLAAIATSQLSTVFKKGEFSRGALNRMLFIPATDLDGWASRRSRAPQRVPAGAMQRLRLLQGIQHEGQVVDTHFQDQVLIEASPTVVYFACDLGGVEDAWIGREQQMPFVLRPLSQGYLETMRRLCVAMAAYANPADPRVTQDILAWCERFTRECLQAAIDEFELSGLDEDDRPDAGQQLLDVITRAGAAGMPKRDLHKYCRAFKRLSTEERSALLDQMLEDELITTHPTSTGRGVRYVACRYVVETPRETGRQMGDTQASPIQLVDSTRVSAQWETGDAQKHLSSLQSTSL
jgi:hypothetical protein